MINQLVEIQVRCPYCWERFSILIDASVETQEYIEDCEICCRPIDFNIAIDGDDRPIVEARHMDE